MFTAANAGVAASGALAIMYVIAATAWWITRIWHLLRRQPPPEPAAYQQRL